MCCYVILWNDRQCLAIIALENWNLQWIPALIYDTAMLVELALLHAGRPNLAMVAWSIIIMPNVSVEHWVCPIVFGLFSHFAGFVYLHHVLFSNARFCMCKLFDSIAPGCYVFCYAAPLPCTGHNIVTLVVFIVGQYLLCGSTKNYLLELVSKFETRGHKYNERKHKVLLSPEQR